jgi:hypothetical protein
MRRRPLPSRALTGFARTLRDLKARRISMLDIVFIVLGIGILAALGFYARAIGKL